VNFETYEVDLQNKSEEFLAASPTGKVPVVVADGDSLYESNGVNQYLDEIFESPRLLPEGPKKRAYARIWMASADDDFFPAVFVAGVGRERGFSEDRISEALEKLKAALGAFGALEERLRGSRVPRGRVLPRRHSPRRQLVRLRELAEKCDIALADYPNVAAWMQRIKAREGYKAAG
jgi:glutathione S-transferase